MKSEYKRKDFDNYICFSCEKDEIEKECMYELKVLENNKIKGILETYISEEDGNINISFKINHTQNLLRFIERKVWTRQEIKLFLENFCKSIKSPKEFILGIDNILINMDYIFVEPESLKVYFCYIPGLNRDMNNSIAKFFLSIIDKIKTEDREVLGILHSCYKLSKIEEFCLEDIEKEISRQNIRTENPEIETKNIIKDVDKVEQSKNIKQDIFDESLYEEDILVCEDDKNKKESPTFSIKSLFSKKKKEEKEDIVEKDEWQDYFDIDLSDKEVKEDEDNYDCEHTVLLTAKPSDKNPILRCISDEKLNIKIKYFPFVVGRQARLCDFCLDREGVSRIHFRIEKIDDDFVVCDLNSRNGIKVEGRVLENEEYCVIKRGYKLEIADLIYIFE